MSDGACQVWGGHLEPGTLVQKGVDLLLGLPEPTASGIDAVPAPERIELAVLPGCPWCERALRLLRTLNLPYRVETIENDADFHRWQARSGMRTFPQIFVDGGGGGLTSPPCMQLVSSIRPLRSRRFGL